MEVAFNVAWGPLSQIAVPLIDVNSAVQLAVGAYGWWKARERTLSLVEIVHANGGRLVPSMTFNLARYLAIREASEFRGIVWFDGRLESVPVPKASTAKMGDAGLLCLRAIVTALLVLYDVESTTAILAYIIPHCLINFDLECEPSEAKGPFLATVKQFVTAVAAEEDCDTMKRKLRKQIDEAYNHLFPASMGPLSLKCVQDIEIPIIIGILVWTLTSTAKRAETSYLTRSLVGWSLAVALSNIGFDSGVSASSTLITSLDVYKDQCSRQGRAMVSKVCLVTCNNIETDSLRPTPGVVRPRYPTPSAQIVAIRAIPTLIFRHLRHESSSIDVEGLCNIWEDAFDNASQSISVAQIYNTNIDISDCSGRKTQRRQPLVHTESNPEGRRPIALSGAVGLLEVIGSRLKKYIPRYEWTPKELFDVLDTWSRFGPYRLYPLSVPYNLDAKTDWYIFVSIVLSTVFALVSKSLHSYSMDMDESGQYLEVAIYSDLLSDQARIESLRQLFLDLQDLLAGPVKHDIDFLPMERWIRTVFNVCTGEPLESDQCFKEGLVGYYANGVFVIMDIILRPSLQPCSLLNFHVQLGQPLQIPISEQGFVVTAEQRTNPGSVAREVDVRKSPTIDLLTTREPDLKVRIDIDPHWEDDPRKVVFRARVGGVVECTINPHRLITDIARATFVHNVGPVSWDGSIHVVHCTCGSPSVGHPAPSTQKWKMVELSQLLKAPAGSSSGVFGEEYYEYSLRPKLESGSRDLLYVHTAKDCLAQVFVCTCFPATPRIVAMDCLRCAYEHWDKMVKNAGPWDNLGAILIDAIETVSHTSTET
jgi:hypothetical protein